MSSPSNVFNQFYLKTYHMSIKGNSEVGQKEVTQKVAKARWEEKQIVNRQSIVGELEGEEVIVLPMPRHSGFLSF